MWKNIFNTPCYLSYCDDSKFIDYYKIYVTDFMSIWYVFYSRSNFLLCIKESNLQLQMKDDVMLRNAMVILSNPKELKNSEIKFVNNHLTLIMTKQFVYPFKLKMQLVKGSKELFFQKITQPILQTVQELKDNRVELCELLVKKDKEIEKLRNMGQTHSHEETAVFKAETFLCKHNKYNHYFGPEKLSNTVLSKTVFIPENIENEKHDGNSNIEIDIKTEPNSEVLDTVGEFYPDGTFVKEEPEINVKNEIKSAVKEKQEMNIKDEVTVVLNEEAEIKVEMGLPKPRKRVKKLNL